MQWVKLIAHARQPRLDLRHLQLSFDLGAGAAADLQHWRAEPRHLRRRGQRHRPLVLRHLADAQRVESAGRAGQHRHRSARQPAPPLLLGRQRQRLWARGQPLRLWPPVLAEHPLQRHVPVGEGARLRRHSQADGLRALRARRHRYLGSHPGRLQQRRPRGAARDLLRRRRPRRHHRPGLRRRRPLPPAHDRRHLRRQQHPHRASPVEPPPPDLQRRPAEQHPDRQLRPAATDRSLGAHDLAVRIHAGERRLRAAQLLLRPEHRLPPAPAPPHPEHHRSRCDDGRQRRGAAVRPGRRRQPPQRALLRRRQLAVPAHQRGPLPAGVACPAGVPARPHLLLRRRVLRAVLRRQLLQLASRHRCLDRPGHGELRHGEHQDQVPVRRHGPPALRLAPRRCLGAVPVPLRREPVVAGLAHRPAAAERLGVHRPGADQVLL
jgi:hypothetical protein